MSIYKRGDVWWYYVTHEGRRYRGSTGHREKPAAQRFHDELRAELWSRRRGGRTFHGALDAWAKDKGQPDRYRVGKLKRTTQDWPLEAIDEKALAAAIPHRKPGTFNRYLNLLGAAGVKVGLEPMKDPAAKGRIRWLTANEWKALRAKLPPWQVPMADFALSTGLRQANVFRLEWSQVDLRRKVAIVHPDQAKAGKPLRVKLQPVALRVLRAQQGKHPRWVFTSEKKPDQPPNEIKVGWAAAVKRAKIPHCTWHDLRHTWATWHLMGGTPIEVLQKLGGWADLRMVLRYAHLADSHTDQYAGNAKPYQPKRAA